jgi:hypothetical protein
MSQTQEKPSQSQELALGVMNDDEDDFLLGADGEAPQACPLDPEGKGQCESCQ